MKKSFSITLTLVFALIVFVGYAQSNTIKDYHEQYRPQIHFSPKGHWMNDPNGMVYFNETYHLFYQYYPDASVWGPMHWGHATSKDLVHWKELSIALYPDSLGYIFSGSAVVDSSNTSGFGKNGKIPLVAIFTHHDPKGDAAGKTDFETQSIAYSLDNGITWTKYAGNPVLKNPGTRDFRDPKVMWHASQKKWVMSLAVHDHISFYSSGDLKTWNKESDFGSKEGAHGGVWECPDMFSMKLGDKVYWILIVNINPGGPNGGSATQYFLGNFDGSKFTPLDTVTRWLDYGPDEYAGITWSNTGSRKVFLGWMSNWLYANQVPTEIWRSATTLPRELSLVQSTQGVVLASRPISELDEIKTKTTVLQDLTLQGERDFSSMISGTKSQYQLKITVAELKDYTVKLSNSDKEEILIGYDKENDRYYIDRTNSGNSNFHKNFAGRFTAPRLTGKNESDITIVVDKMSVEVFADGGLTTMTAIYFSSKEFSALTILAPKKISIRNVAVTGLGSIWK